MTAALLFYGFGFGSGALAGVFLARWLARQRPDPYPGGDALREYTKSEFEHRPAHDGEQPKDGKS